VIVQLDSKQARSIDELAHSMQLQRIRSNERATAGPRTVFPGPLATLALLCGDGVARVCLTRSIGLSIGISLRPLWGHGVLLGK
jgi:hypothetical protein